MRKDAEEGGTGEGGDEREVEVGGAKEEEQREGGADELRQVDEEVLIARVYAVVCEIGGVGVVEEVVEGCYDGMGEGGRECEFAGCVESSIDADSYKGCEKCENDDEDEREWSTTLVSFFSVCEALGDALSLEVGE